jgi:hypothetical protein
VYVVRSSVVLCTERVPVRALSIQMYSPSRATRGNPVAALLVVSV